MGNDSCLGDDGTDSVADLAPSAKLVFEILERDGECTQQELAREAGLSQRTIRNAIRALEANGLVTSRINFRDTRQHLYAVPSDSETDERRE